MNKPIFLVLYPYKFASHVFNYLELDAFKIYCDVSVWDLSPLLNQAFSKSISAERSSRTEVVQIATLKDLKLKLQMLKEASKNTNVCIFNALAEESFNDCLSYYYISTYLSNTSISIFRAYYGGVPLQYTPNLDYKKVSAFKKLANLLNSATTLREFSKKVSSKLFNKISSLIQSPTTHALVAGRQYLQRFDASLGPVKVIEAHCPDYSNFLLNGDRIANAQTQDLAVLLDAPGPMFGSDYIHLKRKVTLTTDVWYPKLTLFFDWLEAQTAVEVQIAGHYKASHPFIAPCFGNRKVHYNETAQLVKNSKFVITRSSAAISYAVLFRKPILFIYSNQLKEDDLAMKDTIGMANMLGTIPINIDSIPEDISPFLIVNEKLYARYEELCLSTFNTKRSNAQIILEDIMNINTGSTFEKMQIQDLPA